MLLCSTSQLPKLDRAGMFPLVNPTFDFCYRGPTHVLHLYEYDAIMNVDGERLVVQSGDVTCIAAGRIYSFSASDPGSHWCIHFHDSPAEGDPGFTLQTHLPLSRNSILIAEQFRLISRLHNSPIRRSERRLLFQREAEARLKALLLNLSNLQHAEEVGRGGGSGIDWDALSRLLEEGLGGLVTTAGLASQLEINPGLLARKFREKHGCTIKQHLLRKRIERAESLLTTTTLTIQEVGAAVGIGDPQYFNKQFRKVAGLSPSRYRERNKQLLASRSRELATRDGQWRDAHETGDSG